METEMVVIDPHDVQLDTLAGMGLTDLDLDKPVDPQVVQMMIQERIVNLTELKAYKHRIEELLTTNNHLRDERENLRVELSGYQEREKSFKKVSWFEILASVTSGFAINMLSTNHRDGVGWFVLILSLLMLGGSRISELPALFERVRGKGKNNA